MNILMILLLLLPILSYLIAQWLTSEYLLNRRWLSVLFIIISGLVGFGIFIVLLLINTPDYVQTISIVWANIARHSMPLSLSLNNLSGLILALWAMGSLIFTILIATDYFDPNSFRENLANLSLGVLAVNGLILANDFLLFIFFWALIDFSIYRIIFRKLDKTDDTCLPNFMVIGGHIWLMLAALSLFKISGTLRFDLIFDDVLVGKISTQQLILPGSMLVLAGIFRTYSPFFRFQLNSQEKAPISNEFILFCGLMPSGAFLLLKLFPIVPQICINGLMILSGIIALIFLIVYLARTDFNQFLHLNTIFQISLIIITIGLGSLTTSAYLVFILFMTNFMAIILIQDFQPTSDSVNFSIALPIRLIIWLSLMGLPISLAFNSRLRLLQISSAFSTNEAILQTIITVILILSYFINVVLMFRTFLITSSFKPKRRKTFRVAPLTHWIICGMGIFCLSPFFTLPYFNPLTTELRFLPLFSNNGVQLPDYSQYSLNLLVIYSAILVIGLIVGFILSKYFKAEKFAQWLANIKINARKYSITPVVNCSRIVSRRIVQSDTTFFPGFNKYFAGIVQQTAISLNRINTICAQKISRLVKIPEKFLNKILESIYNLKFQVLIAITLSILIITVLICII